MAEAAKAKDWSCTQRTFLNDKNEDFCRICGCPKKNNKYEQSSVASQEHSQLLLVSDKISMDSNAPLPPPMHNVPIPPNVPILILKLERYFLMNGHVAQ